MNRIRLSQPKILCSGEKIFSFSFFDLWFWTWKSCALLLVVTPEKQKFWNKKKILFVVEQNQLIVFQPSGWLIDSRLTDFNTKNKLRKHWQLVSVFYMHCPGNCFKMKLYKYRRGMPRLILMIFLPNRFTKPVRSHSLTGILFNRSFLAVSQIPTSGVVQSTGSVSILRS